MAAVFRIRGSVVTGGLRVDKNIAGVDVPFDSNEQWSPCRVLGTLVRLHQKVSVSKARGVCRDTQKCGEHQRGRQRARKGRAGDFYRGRGWNSAAARKAIDRRGLATEKSMSCCVGSFSRNTAALSALGWAEPDWLFSARSPVSTVGVGQSGGGEARACVAQGEPASRRSDRGLSQRRLGCLLYQLVGKSHELSPGYLLSWA